MKMLRTFAVVAVIAGIAMSLSAPGVLAAPGPLVVTKSANASSVLPGGQVVYTINVRNSGDATADNVVLTDTLNGNLTLVSGSPTPGVTAGANGATNLAFNLGSITAGATATATITANVSSGLTTTGAVSNTATATSTNAGTAASNTVSITVGPLTPSIIISKVPNAPTITAGGSITYAVTVRNIGGADAMGVVVSDILDPATTLTSVVPTPATSGSGTVSFNVGTLAPQSSFTFNAVVRINDGTAVGTVIDNNIRVTGSNFTTVQAPSAVTVVAAVGSPTPTPSASVTPTPSVSRTPTPSPVAVVTDPDDLPTTGVGEVLVWILVALALLSLWPLLSRKTPVDREL